MTAIMSRNGDQSHPGRRASRYPSDRMGQQYNAMGGKALMGTTSTTFDPPGSVGGAYLELSSLCETVCAEDANRRVS